MQQKKNGLRCAQILWKYWLNVVWCIDLIQNSNYTKELQSNRNQWEVNSLIFVCGGKLSRALYDFVCCWCFVSVSVCVCVCVLICACVWRFKFDTQSANLLLFLLIFFLSIVVVVVVPPFATTIWLLNYILLKLLLARCETNQWKWVVKFA